MPFIVEWSWPSEGESESTTWANMEEALKAACNDMVRAIRDTWDMTDAQARADGREINNLVLASDYADALSTFNKSDSNVDTDPQYWHVYETSERTFPGDPLTLNDGFFDDPDEDEDPDQDEEQPESVAVQVAAPTVAVNDHTCVACGNTACSKTEKACWRCGHAIRP
jgi:hypothetical protein